MLIVFEVTHKGIKIVCLDHATTSGKSMFSRKKKRRKRRVKKINKMNHMVDWTLPVNLIGHQL